MTIYCTECGTPLPDNASFCTNCGTHVAHINNTVASGPTQQMSQAQPTQQMPQAQTTQQIPQDQATQQMPQSEGSQQFYAPENRYQKPQRPYTADGPQPPYQQPAVYGEAATGQAQPPQQEKPNALLIAGVAIGVLSLIIIVLCVYFFAIAPQSGAKSVSTSVSVSKSSTASSSSSSSSATSSDKAYGAQLLAIYDSMAGLDARIADCADDFNSYYTNPSKSVRQGYADTAKTVQDDVNKQISALKQLKSKTPSSYATETKHVDELLNDLSNRIRVINSAWSNSWSYSNPADHTAEIIAPIEADKSEGGNKYNVHFKEYYPAWKFTIK